MQHLPHWGKWERKSAGGDGQGLRGKEVSRKEGGMGAENEKCGKGPGRELWGRE